MRRIDVGGKALTNYLTELVSYRALDLSDEIFVVEKMKEDVCFVAQDCARALATPSTLDIEYVLPDFGDVKMRRNCAPVRQHELELPVGIKIQRAFELSNSHDNLLLSR